VLCDIRPCFLWAPASTVADMRNLLKLLSFFLLSGLALAATKPHIISFGKAVSAKWFVGPDETYPLELKVRALYIDSRLKEFTLGLPHDVTDRLFVVRRAFHVNDALPQDGTTAPRWRWQRGGWLLVDRNSGHISQLSLPEFDTYYSAPSWYRDYVAYCGVSDDGKKAYAMVAQLGRRKPVLKKPLGEAIAREAVGTPVSSGPSADAQGSDLPDSECPAPSWQRQPPRVTFAPKGQTFTYSVRGHDAEVLNVADDEEGTQ
jgi:hypothetical protein